MATPRAKVTWRPRIFRNEVRSLAVKILQDAGKETVREIQGSFGTGVSSPGQPPGVKIRELGRRLGLPEAIVGRHPFPGPGLAVRIPGEVTPERLHVLRAADAIFREELTRSGWMEKTAQLAGAKAPKLQLPLWLSLWCARRMRSLLPLVGKPFEVDDASIEMADLFWYCDSGKARRELGFKTRDPMATLRDTIEDIRERKPER